MDATAQHYARSFTWDIEYIRHMSLTRYGRNILKVRAYQELQSRKHIRRNRKLLSDDIRRDNTR